jgi:hypothetical protein
MPSRKKSPRRRSPRRRSPARRSLMFNPKLSVNLPKMVINEGFQRYDTVENLIDSIISPGTNRVPRDVANIIAEYDDYDDGSRRFYWKNQIRDLDAYRRGERSNNPYMMYEVTKDKDGLIHHKEWYENGSKRTDCSYYFNKFAGEKLFHGNCKQWNENGFLVYDRTFKNGEEKIMSKITGKGSKINLYKVHDEYDD